jgi:hypothetical protein
MRRMFLLLPLLALAGCATGPSLQSRMAGYIGDNAQTLVQSLGVPDKQITAGGVEYLDYRVRHSELVEPDDFGLGGGLSGPIGLGYADPLYFTGLYDTGLPAQVNEWSCDATFMLKDDKVFNVTLRGNDCG